MARPSARRPQARAAVIGLVAALALTGCQSHRDGVALVASTPRAVGPAGTPTAATGPSPVPSPSASPTAEATPSRAAVVPRSVRLDRLAGVRSRKVLLRGQGRLAVVPGDVRAPVKGRHVYRVRVEVERGLDVDRAAFARYVMATLNDRRSWTEGGRRAFARTDGPADFSVVLASPDTSAALCRPLRTFGKLSCGRGRKAVLTTYRWVKAIPEYSADRDGYRHYVVNHEVGHLLGHPHEYCAGQGRVAPVMMQQTKGLKGCRPNPWPHP
jgi:Protein of unknown function (DUF3152)